MEVIKMTEEKIMDAQFKDKEQRDMNEPLTRAQVQEMLDKFHSSNAKMLRAMHETISLTSFVMESLRRLGIEKGYWTDLEIKHKILDIENQFMEERKRQEELLKENGVPIDAFRRRFGENA